MKIHYTCTVYMNPNDRKENKKINTVVGVYIGVPKV